MPSRPLGSLLGGCVGSTMRPSRACPANEIAARGGSQSTCQGTSTPGHCPRAPAKRSSSWGSAHGRDQLLTGRWCPRMGANGLRLGLMDCRFAPAHSLPTKGFLHVCSRYRTSCFGRSVITCPRAHRGGRRPSRLPERSNQRQDRPRRQGWGTEAVGERTVIDTAAHAIVHRPAPRSS